MDKPWATDGFRAIVRKRHNAHVMHNNHVKAILIHKKDEIPAEYDISVTSGVPDEGRLIIKAAQSRGTHQ